MDHRRKGPELENYQEIVNNTESDTMMLCVIDEKETNRRYNAVPFLI